MKINTINTINSPNNNQINQRRNHNAKVYLNNASFDFSSASSNAIRSNALANISFKSKDIKTSEAKSKEMAVIVDAFNVYSEVMQVFRHTVPDCAKEAKELYNLASNDVQNASNDRCLTLKQTIYNGKIVPYRLLRVDRLGQPIYSADFSNGKISQINEFDMSGNISKTVKFNEETGDLLSYQRNLSDENTEYDFLIEYDSEFGISELAKYFESPTQDSNGNKKYAKVIEFINEETLEYKEDVVITPQGEEIEAKRIFDFENLSTFDYCSHLKKAQGEETEYGEKIRIENNNMTSWE